MGSPLRRLAAGAVALLGVSFVTFLIPWITPGDPARKILRARVSGLDVDEAGLERLRSLYGLDQPLLVQYGGWLGRAVRGDLGSSWINGTPVADLLGRSLLVTAVLVVSALALAIAVALPLGAWAAVRKDRPADTVITGVTQAFVAIPEYWLAPILVLVFALHLGALPSAGWTGPASLVLPAVTLALRPLSYFTQVTRASMVDVLGAPHMVAARARGLSLPAAVLRHAVRNSLLPVITLLSVWLGGLLGGSVVVEVIFGVPGMGRLLYQAVVNGDVPVMQAGIVSLVALTIVVTTATDAVSTVVNPTLRSSRAPA